MRPRAHVGRARPTSDEDLLRKKVAGLVKERDNLIRQNLKTATALDAANAASTAMIRVIEYVNLLKSKRSKAYSTSITARYSHRWLHACGAACSETLEPETAADSASSRAGS